MLAAVSALPALAQLPTLPGVGTSTTTTTTAPAPTTVAPAPRPRPPRRTTTTSTTVRRTTPSSTSTTAAPASTPTEPAPRFEIETLEAARKRGRIVVRVALRNQGEAPLAATGEARLLGQAEERVAGPAELDVPRIPPSGRGVATASLSEGSEAIGETVVVTVRAGRTTRVARAGVGAGVVEIGGSTDDRRGLMLLVASGLAAAVGGVLRFRYGPKPKEEEEEDVGANEERYDRGNWPGW